MGKVYDADSLLAHVNNDKDTHKDKDKEGENFQEEKYSYQVSEDTLYKCKFITFKT